MQNICRYLVKIQEEKTEHDEDKLLHKQDLDLRTHMKSL